MAFENLRFAFQNEKSQDEIQKIAKGAFVHLAEFGIEWLRLLDMIRHPEKYLAGFHGAEKMHRELEKGKGAILLVSHVGNQEVMALIAGLFLAKPVNRSIYALARPLKNPYLYQHAVRLRGGMGLKTIDKQGGVREAFDQLRKENAIVCILIDQRISEGSIEVNFFGRPALTTTLPVLAALRIGSPIFFSGFYRTPDSKYEMNLDDQFLIERTGDYKKDIRVNTQRFIDRIETEIRKDPARWLWVHNRWRAQHGPKD